MNNRGHPVWSEADDDYLRENWGRMTGSQIAAEIGRTKNAVIGRAHRLGLRKLATAPPRSKKVKLEPIPVRRRPTIAESRAYLASFTTRPQPGRWLAFEDLRVGQCRWPDECQNLRKPATRFCAAPADAGTYCAEHHRLAYRQA